MNLKVVFSVIHSAIVIYSSQISKPQDFCFIIIIIIAKYIFYLVKQK